jgi:hypothetical protein
MSSEPVTNSGIWRIVLFLCGAVVIGWLAWSARGDLVVVLTGIRPGFFAVAVLLGVVFAVAQGALFSRLMAKHGSDAGSRELVAAFLLSQPGKYIPGKVWPAVMQSLALRGKSSFAGIAVANVELIVVAISQMTALGLAALWIASPFIAVAPLASGLALGAVIIMFPTAALIRRLPVRVTALLRVSLSEGHCKRPSIWNAVGLSSLVLGLNLAASLCVLLAAGPSISTKEYAPILASLYLGFAASLLAVPVPAGIGIREAATVGLGLLVATGVPSSILISVALLARCWQLVTDVACLGLGAAMLVRHRQLGKT